MSLPQVTIRQLMEAGVHFGHHKRRWNPKMEQFIFGVRNNIHIIDLDQTLPLLQNALNAVKECAANGGRILFVGTKRQASSIVADYAKKCGQYYINHRWLGGTLTNWKIVSLSIKKLKELETHLQSNIDKLSKKEVLSLMRQKEKLELALGGIKDMGGLPNIIFVIDTNKEKTAIEEAKKLRIPVIAIVDTNSEHEGINYPIPGNDDATRAIELYCDLVSQSILEGLQKQIASSGVDIGASTNIPEEVVVEVESEAGKE